MLNRHYHYQMDMRAHYLYSAGGWVGLIEEIKMEIDRISSRNLGRDDR